MHLFYPELSLRIHLGLENASTIRTIKTFSIVVTITDLFKKKDQLIWVY